MSKTVQKSGAQPAVRQDSHAVYPTHYAVKIHSLRLEGSCRATASVNINGCFAVRGIKVMDSSKGLFVSMPSYRAGNGEYKDICFSCTKEARMEFDSAVLDAYQQALVQAQAQSQAARKAPWPTKVKVTLGIMFGVLVACLVVRLAVPSLQENQILNSATTLLLGLSCGALYLIRKDYPAPKPSKLDGVVNAVLIVFALVYGLLGVWGLLQLFA